VAGPVEARLKSYRYQPRDRRSAGSLDNDMAMRSPSLQQDYDLPTIEPRRRRRFELHRIEVQRRFGGGDTGSLHREATQTMECEQG